MSTHASSCHENKYNPKPYLHKKIPQLIAVLFGALPLFGIQAGLRPASDFEVEAIFPIAVLQRRCLVSP